MATRMGRTWSRIRLGGRRIDRGRDRGVAALLLWLRLRPRLLLRPGFVRLLRRTVLSPPLLLSPLVTHLTGQTKSPEPLAPGFLFGMQLRTNNQQACPGVRSATWSRNIPRARAGTSPASP